MYIIQSITNTYEIYCIHPELKYEVKAEQVTVCVHHISSRPSKVILIENRFRHIDHLTCHDWTSFTFTFRQIECGNLSNSTLARNFHHTPRLTLRRNLHTVKLSRHIPLLSLYFTSNTCLDSPIYHSGPYNSQSHDEKLTF